MEPDEQNDGKEHSTKQVHVAERTVLFVFSFGRENGFCFILFRFQHRLFPHVFQDDYVPVCSEKRLGQSSDRLASLCGVYDPVRFGRNESVGIPDVSGTAHAHGREKKEHSAVPLFSGDIVGGFFVLDKG